MVHNTNGSIVHARGGQIERASRVWKGDASLPRPYLKEPAAAFSATHAPLSLSLSVDISDAHRTYSRVYRHTRAIVK